MKNFSEIFNKLVLNSAIPPHHLLPTIHMMISLMIEI